MATPPAADELEITVFGRGFGESILIHIGDGRWVVVDSFRDAAGRPIAETYLAELTGDHRVAAVVLTHWDDDHTKGASDLIKSFEPEEVWIPAVLNNDEAFEFAYAHTEAEPTRRIPLGLREFVAVTDALDERPGVTAFAMPGRSVLEGRSPTVLRFLSPHDEVVKQGFKALGITQRAGFGEIASPRPNDTCSVLWVERGGGNALLGADLEDSRWGWKQIVSRRERTAQSANLVKVPHHGSPDAHNEDVYRTLCNGAWAAATRYTPGVTPRPSEEDRERLRGSVPGGWILGAPGPSAPTADIRGHEQVQLASLGHIWPLPGEVGFAQLRYSQLTGEWEPRVFGAVEDL